MKNSKLILVSAILLGLIVFVSGCGKKDDTNPTGTPKIRTISYPQSTPTGTITATDTYVYDSQGRVSSITNTNTAGGSQVTNFVYSANKVTKTDDYNISIYTLNSNGYVALEFDSAFGASVSNSISYTYDANGHVDSKTYIYSSGNYIVYYGWVGDNMTTSTENAGFIYTYLTDKTNTVGNVNKGMSFKGKDSKNLINTSLNSGTTNTYFYEYDSQNRATKVNGSETYTYY